MFVVSNSLLAPKRRAFDHFSTFSGQSHYLWKVLLDRNGRVVLLSIVLYFFGLARHNFTKKDTPGVFFSAVLSNSLNMKRRRVLPLSSSLKLDDIGFRPNDMISPSRLLKIIGVLARNGGENGTVIIVVSVVCRSWTWHLFAFVSRWGHLISFFTCLRGFGWSYLTYHLLIVSSLWTLIYQCQILPNLLSCRQYVQEKLTSAQ